MKMKALMTTSMHGYFQPINPPLTRDDIHIYGYLKTIEETEEILEKFNCAKELERYAEKIAQRIKRNVKDQNMIRMFVVSRKTEDSKWEDKYSAHVFFTEFEVQDGKVEEVFGKNGEGRKIARRIAEKEWEEIKKISMEPVNPREVYTYFELSSFLLNDNF